MRPTPLTQDELLGLFKGETVGRDVAHPATSQEDMRGGVAVDKPSLEVVYDAV
jgi:chlorophyllide a reductase subunit X